jgi:hypothetical protein
MGLSMTDRIYDLERVKRRADFERVERLQANWDSVLRAALAAMVGVVLVAILLPEDRINRQGALGATVKMERLAVALEHTKSIAPDTASEISRLMQRPQFDCERTDCEAALTARNHAARLRLKAVLDRHVTAEATVSP